MRKFFIFFSSLTVAVLLFLLLYWRGQYALTRYFDIDEFAHLHWGYSFFIGEKPYQDFFYLFPPFFLLLLWPVFLIFGRTLLTVTASRALMFIIFLLIVLVLYLMARRLRSKMTALLAVLVLVFLPMPLDKMIEIRPDLPALLAAMTGLLLFISGEGKESYRDLFFSGLFFGISLGFVPKTVFFLTGPVLIVIYQYFQSALKGKMKGFFRKYLYLFYGMSIPLTVILTVMMWSGKADFAFYSMTKMASDVTKVLAGKFYIDSRFFFYPNDVYYGKGSINPYYLANLFIYLTAIIWVIWRFISSLSFKEYRKCVAEFVLSLTFLVNLAAYVKFYPLKHAQYLIPLAPFAAFYFADFWQTLIDFLARKLIFPIVLTPVLAVFLVIFFKDIYDIRIWWNNRLSMEKINYFLSSYSSSTAIFDLTGESVFFPNGYYFCCIPYGQYNEAFDFKMPDIEKDMERRKTTIVHLGTSDRIGVLPAIQAKYIKENFEAILPNGSLLERKQK